MFKKYRNKTRRFLRKWAKPLALSFAVASTPLVAEEEHDPTGLWKVNMFDIVVDVKACPEKQYCPTIHWIAEGERDVYKWFGPKRQKRHFDRDDVLSLCGQDMTFDIDQKSPNKYEGEIRATGKAMDFDVKMKMLSADRVRVDLSYGFFPSVRDVWRKIPDWDQKNFPKCTPVKTLKP